MELHQDLVQTNTAFVKITGTEYEYAVTILSRDITVEESESFESMKIGSFRINYSNQGAKEKTLYISATLNVGHNQSAGTSLQLQR